MDGAGKIHRSRKRVARQPEHAGTAGAGTAKKGRRKPAHKIAGERLDAPALDPRLADAEFASAENGVEQNALSIDEDRNGSATDIERALGTETPDASVKPRSATSIE